jgi:hypothetical protein
MQRGHSIEELRDEWLPEPLVLILVRSLSYWSITCTPARSYILEM